MISLPRGFTASFIAVPVLTYCICLAVACSFNAKLRKAAKEFLYKKLRYEKLKRWVLRSIFWRLLREAWYWVEWAVPYAWLWVLWGVSRAWSWALERRW